MKSATTSRGKTTKVTTTGTSHRRRLRRSTNLGASQRVPSHQDPAPTPNNMATPGADAVKGTPPDVPEAPIANLIPETMETKARTPNIAATPPPYFKNIEPKEGACEGVLTVRQA